MTFLLLQEVKQLVPAISKCLNIPGVVSMLKDNCKLYPHVFLVYQFLSTLPITVSSNERSFSELKLTIFISSIECDLLDSTNVQQLANQ